MPDVVYVGTARKSAFVGNGASTIAPLPGGTQAGDVALVFAYANGTGPVSLGGLDSWSQDQSGTVVDAGSGSHDFSTAYGERRVGSETGYTVTNGHPSNGAQVEVVVSVYRNVGSVTNRLNGPKRAGNAGFSHSIDFGADPSPISPGGARVVQGGVIAGGPTLDSYTFPSGYTARLAPLGTPYSVFAADLIVGTAWDPADQDGTVRNGIEGQTVTRQGVGWSLIESNTAPGTPTSLAPSGAQGVNTATLSAVVTDPDGDQVRANFEYSTDNANWTSIFGNYVNSGGTSTASFSGSGNTTYYLRARAQDIPGAVSGYTATQTFVTNRPPGAPAVTAPNGGEKYNTLGTVSWTPGSDPDGNLRGHQAELTTNGGTSWSNIVGGDGVVDKANNSFTYDFTNVAASTACRVRVRAIDTLGAVSTWDESNANFTIEHNRPPTAPLLGQPPNGATADLAAGYTFTYTATDPDTSDPASAWAFRRKIAGASVYEYWNAGTAAWQSTIQWNTNPTGSVAFASGKWTNGNTYNWSVATKDTQGVEGPFAADFSVTSSTVATATVTEPTGSVTTTSRPLVRWTLTQPEGQPQQTYQVRIFTAAQYGATGFDPATSTAVWDTPETTSAGAREIQPTVDLLNGTTYRTYVRLKSANLHTAWANSTFSMALTPPPPVTFTVTDEPTSPFGPRVRVDVDLNFAAPFTRANTTITVERSDDAGLTWTVVRGGERMPLTVDGGAVLLDYEPPRAVPVQYRAFSVGDV